MNTEELKIWLDKPEGDHHDFKEHWYHKGQKPELVKDIFSFVNTVHHDDCLLILGVNDQRKVTGVEDDENWRLNQQQLIDFMRKLPISGELIPRLGVETIHMVSMKLMLFGSLILTMCLYFLGESGMKKGFRTMLYYLARYSQGNRMLTLLEIQPLTIIKLKGYSKNILEWIHQLKNGISIL